MASGPLEDLVTHKFVQTNGIKLHYVEAGSGPTVLLLHGFPDFWYGWRHQIPALVAAGYHVVALDLRGFGESDAPDSIDKYTELHIVGDLIGLLDHLEVKQSLVVTHDWGAVYGADLVLFRPDRVKALVLLGLPYMPRLSQPVLWDFANSETYFSVFQAPGVAEDLFKKAKTEDIFSAFYLRWNTSENVSIPPFIPNEPLPKWITKDELSVYAKAFDKRGWSGGLNHYRSFTLSWELKAPWTDAILPAEVPVMSMMGRQDIAAKFFNIQSASDEHAFVARSQETTPGLKAHHFIDAMHFLHQEKYEEVNKVLLQFLHDYKDKDCNYSFSNLKVC